MTHSQWVYYFAAELASVVQHMSFEKAVAFGRVSVQDEAPEIAARFVAALLIVVPARRRSLRRTRRARLAARVALH